MDNYRFILSGGGTGGHIFPAIAIANELKLRYPQAEFLFVGAKDRMEMEKVPQAGYKIEGLWISGIQRKLTLKNLMFPLKLLSSLVKSQKIVGGFKPHVVIGTGGFASGPLLRVASGRGIPCVIQEQNSYAGVTNKLLASRVQKICVAYDGMESYFPADKIVKTGNPVRSDLVHGLTDSMDAAKFYGLDGTKPILLILGGSLGAARINSLIKEKLDFFASLGMQLIWQCGKLYYEEYVQYTSDTVKVFDFMNRMDLAYGAADIIVSRAGAGSVSELSLVGKPVVFVPSPNVAEDHQTKNARSLVDRKAAIMIREKDLDATFEELFENLFRSEERQRELGSGIKKLALPNATKDIADVIGKLMDNGH
ncbi:MAG: undecaprenyldiphospho-muramoylpentapeptide beta-N-acetylglucosaminyltransferase [Sediminicola sp.]